MSRKTTLTVRPRHNCDAKVIGWKLTEPFPGQAKDVCRAIECTSKSDAEKSLAMTVKNRIAEGYTSIEIKSYNHDNQLDTHATYHVASSGDVTLEQHKTPALKPKPEGTKPKPATAEGAGYTPAQRAALRAAQAAPAAAPKAAKPRVRKPKAEAAASAPKAPKAAAAAPAAAAPADAKAKGLAKYQRFVKKFKKENEGATKDQIAAAWAAKKGGKAAPAAKAAATTKAPKAAASKAKTEKAPKAAKAAAAAAPTVKAPKAGTKAAAKAEAKAAKAAKAAAKAAKPKRELSPAMAARNKWVQKRIPQLKAAGMDHKEAFGQAQREYSAAQSK